jgi:cell division protein FtsL
MDVRFNDERQKSGGAKTRIYSPTQTGNPTPVLEDSSMPIRPQPTRQPRKKRAARTEVRLTSASKILILLSVFVIAATALFALFGAADYARIISNTNAVNKEIDTLNEQISQLKKTQSSMNDFATINDVCRTLGMTMNWYRGSDDYASDTAAPGTAAPDTAAPSTPAPNGDEP